MNTIFRRLMRLYGLLKLRGRVNLDIANCAQIRLDRVYIAHSCRLRVGPQSIINARISFDRPGSTFACGARCFIGASHVVVADTVQLGDDVVVSWGVTIVDHNSHAVEWADRAADVLDWARGKKNWETVKVAPVRLKDKVWVGFNAIILKGVTVGEGSVVAAGAVVTRDVPPYTVVAGNPARVIRDLRKEIA